MSENQYDLPASDDPEWVGLVMDVETRFEALNDSLADLRSAVVRLSSYRPQPLMAVASAPEAEEPEEQAPGPEEDVAEDEPVAELAADAAAEEPAIPVEEAEADPTEEAEPDAADDAARREEVSRVVAKARERLAGSAAPAFDGSWAAPHAADSTSEGSWPMARHERASGNLPGARMEATKQSPDAGEWPQKSNTDIDAQERARRDDVARMVAQMRAGLDDEVDITMDEAAGESSEPDAAVVADSSGETEQAAGADDSARRDGVAEMVARMRAEMAASNTEDAEDGAAAEIAGEVSESPEDDADVRDEVRRAVEAARAEMASGWVNESSVKDEPEADDKKRFSFPDWQNARIEPSGPPVIVIKDPEGRVELARVYETLSRVNCDENAALLNYTPHSVTVGLNLRAPVPSKESMEKAIQTVFGRACRVESDGVRVSVDLGAGKEHAA